MPGGEERLQREIHYPIWRTVSGRMTLQPWSPAMGAFFDLLTEENDPAVRRVRGFPSGDPRSWCRQGPAARRYNQGLPSPRSLRSPRIHQLPQVIGVVIR